jgi:hypothetical protein
MANYLLVYHGGGNGPSSPEEGQAVMQAWMTWMGGLGAALVDGGNPITRGWTISKDGTDENAGSNPATGYSVITADSMQAALELSLGCPHLASGGTIELCETINASEMM